MRTDTRAGEGATKGKQGMVVRLVGGESGGSRASRLGYSHQVSVQPMRSCNQSMDGWTVEKINLYSAVAAEASNELKIK